MTLDDSYLTVQNEKKTDTRLGRVPIFYEETITFVSGHEHYSQTKCIAFIVKQNLTLSSGK